MIEASNDGLFVIPRHEGSVDGTIKKVLNSSAVTTMPNRITKRTRVRRNESFIVTRRLITQNKKIKIQTLPHSNS